MDYQNSERLVRKKYERLASILLRRRSVVKFRLGVFLGKLKKIYEEIFSNLMKCVIKRFVYQYTKHQPIQRETKKVISLA